MFVTINRYVLPIMISTPIETLMVWCIIVNMFGIIIGHGGYWIGPYTHDRHHKLLKYNYGTNIFMDYLFCTYK